MMNPLNDRRGTLYEVPILITLLLVIVSIALPRAAKEPTFGRGLLVLSAAALVMVLVAAAFFGILFLVFGGLDRLEASRHRTRLARNLRELIHPDADVRRAAVRELRENSLYSEDAAPALTKALGDSDTFVRFEAAAALARMDSDEKAAALLAKVLPAETLPALLSEVPRGPEFDQRYVAAMIARSQGAKASAAAPALEALAKGAGDFDRKIIEGALAAIKRPG
jgi:hypothetical protein